MEGFCRIKIEDILLLMIDCADYQKSVISQKIFPNHKLCLEFIYLI